MTLEQFFQVLAERVQLLLWLWAGVVMGLTGVVLACLALVSHAVRTRSNCLFHAWVRYRQGHYVVMMPSRYGWWPHFVTTQDFQTFEEFSPLARKRRRFMPPLIFSGRAQPWKRRDSTLDIASERKYSDRLR